MPTKHDLRATLPRGAERALARLLAALTACAPLLAEPQAPAVDSAALRLRFEPEHGSLVEFRDKATGYDHADADALLPLWTAAPAEGPAFGPADAARFAWRATPGAEDGLELLWAGFDKVNLPDLKVTARVRLSAGGAESRWSIALEGLGARQLRDLRFPRIACARREAETLAVPVWMGERCRRARDLLHAGGRPGRWEWEYPGLLSMQCAALYGEDGPGLLLAANDTAALRKLFAVFGLERKGLALEIVHVPSLSPGGEARFEPAYEALATAFRGDWYDAAALYRAWAWRQAWVRESRRLRELTPAWLLDTALWVWNRGRSPGVLAPAAALMEHAEVPVSVFWHWWHGCAYDTGFPEYLPPREGEEPFRQALARAQERGIRALVYMNQRLWGMTTRSWVEQGAERWAVKRPDGGVTPEVYNTFNRAPCASMCMGTEFWRGTYAALAEGAVRGLGVDGIYMDQACSSLACYDPGHGHPLGGGAWWMEGFRRLEEDLRARCAPAKPVALAGEGCGEAWLPHLDAMLSLQVSMERYAAPGRWEPIPFFHAVYHACALFFGSYSSLTRPPYDELWPAEFAPARPLELLDRKFAAQFRLEQGRAFAWGQQPTIANFLPGQLADRGEELDFFLRLVRVRRAALPYLRDGVFLRPPAIDAPTAPIPMSRLSIYAGQRDAVREFEGQAPRALASAWAAPDGSIAAALVNISEAPIALDLSLGPPEYAVPPAGVIRKISEAGAAQVRAYTGGRAEWKAELAPGEACVYAIAALRADAVDAYIEGEMRKRGIPAVSLAVRLEGRLVKLAAYGKADVELDVAAGPRTVFQIQSITKTFTSAAILMLMEQGKLALDDPVAAHLAGAPEAWKDITVRHLLSHTSGIKDFINEPTASLRLDVTEEDVLAAAARRPLNFPPGERYAYSNTNYHLLAMIIRKHTGLWYGDFLKARIFAPLGMSDTRIVSHGDIIPGRAAGYDRWDNRLRNGAFIAESILSYGGGGILSTAADLAQWAAAFESETLLKKDTIAQAWTPVKLAKGTNAPYGLGWADDSMNGRRGFGHSGEHATGFSSYLLIHPDDRLAVIVLTNFRRAAPKSLAQHIAGLYVPALAPKPPPPEERR